MPTGHHVDIDALHVTLWEKADRLGRIKVTQKQLTTMLGVNKWTVSRVVARLVEEGRIRKISADSHNAGMFVVNDPTQR